MECHLNNWQAKDYKDNLASTETLAHKCLWQWKNMVIMSADKGSVVVVLHPTHQHASEIKEFVHSVFNREADK